jgi:hypothetical protein
MINFKSTTLAFGLLVFLNQAGFAAENQTGSKQDPVEENTIQRPIITFSENYKKRDIKDFPQSGYKKAIQIGIGDKTSDEDMLKAASIECRKFSFKRRQNYFVNVAKQKGDKALMTISCSDIDEPKSTQKK